MDEITRREFLAGCGGAALGSMGMDARAQRFDGAFIRGEGDVGYLRLLDTCGRMLYPDPELQNLSMLYTPSWNGFVEGPTWDAWWIQNSYGPTYCGMPFFEEPYATFMQNAQDLWFDQMGDGKRVGATPPLDWVAPDGCLCDAARPGWIVYKQGDGRIDIHDWGMEFTAAGLLLQSEALLVQRDPEAIRRYLPKLERCADFLETRRDPQNDLFLAGAAGNLLAPSYAGWRRPDGSYDKAYLAGLSITTIAALDRLIELERLSGRADRAARYTERRDRARRGLPALTTDEGYFVKSIDPDGTKHGVYGAPKHGYFEAVCNHDAIAFRVADDAQSERIYARIASIPGLRPHDVIITNYPSLDDIYTEPTGLWTFGHWVNGGHWTTCEARMILAYYRLGRYDDARRSMEHILRFARAFRMDNNLTDFGARPYQPNLPINCVYDTWGAPTAMLRGLFEYLYTAEGVTLLPHIPPAITRLEQRFPVRFGGKRLYLSTVGSGPVTGVWIDGRSWSNHDGRAVRLPYNSMPAVACVQIGLGGASPSRRAAAPTAKPIAVPPVGDRFWDTSRLVSGGMRSAMPLRIGADSNGEHGFRGAIRRVRIYGRALRESEVAALARDPGAARRERALIADYLFDHIENGSVRNRGGEGLALQTVGEVHASEADAAALFVGQGHFEAPAEARLDLTGAYTLEAWVRPDALLAGGMRIVDRVTAGVDDGYLLDTYPDRGLRFITERGHLQAEACLEPGRWAHVVAALDPTDGLALYLDGRRIAAGPTTAPAAQTEAVALERVGTFLARLQAEGLADGYEGRHADLVVDYVRAIHARIRLRAAGKLPALPPASQTAADRSYLEAAQRLAAGLQRTLEGYIASPDPRRQRLAALWSESRISAGQTGSPAGAPDRFEWMGDPPKR